MMVRRLIYLPLAVNEIKRHFGSITRASKDSDSSTFTPSYPDSSQESVTASSSISTRSISGQAPQSMSSYWFTCKIRENDLILPQHLPIGLLYDLISVFSDFSNRKLPWKLEFHLSTTSPPLSPNSNLLAQVINYTTIPDESYLASCYFSTLKEADHLRSGSARNVMNLTRSEQLQLWESVKSAEFDRFWRINQKLIGSSSTTRNIPIKFWICQPDTFKLTRLQFLIPCDPSLKLETVLSSEFGRDLTERLQCAIIHGVEVPNSILLEELHYNWNYSDNFLNILLILKGK